MFCTDSSETSDQQLNQKPLSTPTILSSVGWAKHALSNPIQERRKQGVSAEFFFSFDFPLLSLTSPLPFIVCHSDVGSTVSQHSLNLERLLWLTVPMLCPSLSTQPNPSMTARTSTISTSSLELSSNTTLPFHSKAGSTSMSSPFVCHEISA